MKNRLILPQRGCSFAYDGKGYAQGIKWLLLGLTLLTTPTQAQELGADLTPFAFTSNEQTRHQACEFSDLTLPDNVAIYAAGAYAGRRLSKQIDQSGHAATQMDVAVNSQDRPVVLMLGSYEPTIWNIGWSEGTNIMAVLVSGYHRQVVAGLPGQIPVLVSSHDNKGSCGYFYVSEQQLERLNPLARRLFDRTVETVFLAREGKVVVGEELKPNTVLVTSNTTRPEEYFEEGGLPAGPAGLEEAERKGLLRRATRADVEEWVQTVAAAPGRDLPPIAGQGAPRPRSPDLINAYVVLKPFTLPAGLYGADSGTFFIPKGVEQPKGNLGHSTVYDFNNLTCRGVQCGR